MNAKYSRTPHHKQGYVLLISLIFTGLIVLGSTLLFRINAQKVFTEKKHANHVRALMIAEAGAHQAFAILTDDFSLRNEPFPVTSINGGTYSIVITDVDTESNAEEILLSSTGTYNEEAAEVALIIRHSTTGSSSTGTDPIVLELFDGAIFCGGDAKMVGASYIELNGATAHINGSLTMTGSAQFKNNGFVSTSTSMTLAGYPQIQADVAVPQTPKIPWGSVGSFIDGTVSIGPVPEQMIELDLEPFRLFAKATDTPGMNYKKAMAWNYQYSDSYISADEINKKLVVSGSSAVNVVPPGGVLWVEGDIKFAGSVNIYACVVATGNIEVKGASVHLQSGGLPSFMSLNGTVEIGAGCKVYGLVYSHNGDIKISGDATVEGAFICPRGDFTHLGSGKVLYKNSRPYGPNGVDVMLPEPEAGEPDGPPEIVGWVK